MSDSATPDIDALIAQLKDNIFTRWMKAAQRQALKEWRDRMVAPGLAARFTREGDTFYGFTPRYGKTDARKGYLPDFVKTGSLRDSMKNRKPLSQNGISDAITRMKYGGGALNFMTDKRGVKEELRVPVTKVASIGNYTRVVQGATVNVTAYTAERKGIQVQIQHGTKSYSAEFAEFSKDAPWIKERVNQIFGEIVRSATMKNGQIRARYREAANG